MPVELAPQRLADVVVREERPPLLLGEPVEERSRRPEPPDRAVDVLLVERERRVVDRLDGRGSRLRARAHPRAPVEAQAAADARDGRHEPERSHRDEPPPARCSGERGGEA